MKSYYSNHKRGHMHNEKPVNVYRDGIFVRTYESHMHLHNSIGVSLKTICSVINTGNPCKEGYVLWDKYKDPNRMKVEVPKIDSNMLNRQVAMFDRPSKQMLAVFDSVTQCANALQRPSSTVMGWLCGQRCTDPDCYYKFYDQCTQEEINNRYKL